MGKALVGILGIDERLKRLIPCPPRRDGEMRGAEVSRNEGVPLDPRNHEVPHGSRDTLKRGVPKVDSS